MYPEDETITDLLRARARLIARRVKLDALIDGMEDLIIRAGGSLEDEPRPASIGPSVDSEPATPVDDRPTARQAVTALLRSEDRPLSMTEIVRRVPEFGTSASPETVRSLISKMLKAGNLERPGRGLYELAHVPVTQVRAEPEVTAPDPPSHEVSPWTRRDGQRQGVRMSGDLRQAGADQ